MQDETKDPNANLPDSPQADPAGSPIAGLTAPPAEPENGPNETDAGEGTDDGVERPQTIPEPEPGPKADPEPAPEPAPPAGYALPMRTLMPGTVVQMFGEPMTLLQPVEVTYPKAENEQHFVGLAQATNNVVANRSQIKFRYGLDARLESLEDQVEDREQMPAFIASLTVEEAARFGIEEQLLEDYKKQAAGEADDRA